MGKHSFAVICLDGINWQYVQESRTPFIDSLIREGTSETCITMIPSVTNVNNASIITCSFPEKHGITSNWYYDRNNEKEVYMDSNRFLTCQTYLEKEMRKGRKVLFLSVKDKLRRLLASEEIRSYSVEKPDKKIVEEIGSPPDIYELEASPWLIKAAIHEVNKIKYDFIYLSTTDFIPHKFEPKEQEAIEYMQRIDEELESLFNCGYEIGIVADHGMNPKKVNFDPIKRLNEFGLNGRIVAAIKDEHVIHHMNLGGSAYLYLENYKKAKEILQDSDGVEKVFCRTEAAKEFKLIPDRIGDLLILADKEHTFGLNEKTVYRDIDIRSHGSLHESKVPFILSNKIPIHHALYNKDVIPSLSKPLENR